MSKSNKTRRSSHWEAAATNTRRSQRQEKRVSRELGARQTKASGAMSHDKSDAETQEWRYEMKTTGGKSLSMVKVNHLEKIWKEAVKTSKCPALVVTAEAMEGSAPQDWVMMTLEDFKALTGQEPKEN